MISFAHHCAEIQAWDGQAPNDAAFAEGLYARGSLMELLIAHLSVKGPIRPILPDRGGHLHSNECPQSGDTRQQENHLRPAASSTSVFGCRSGHSDNGA